MSNVLFKRKWKVKIGPLVSDGGEISQVIVEDLDIAFDIRKSLKMEPNKCELRIWNLREDHRSAIEKLSLNKKKGQGKIRVEIEAGYESGTSLIFRGDMRTAYTFREGPDLITKVEGEDGGQTALKARVQRSFPEGTQKRIIVQACAEAMGIGSGNLNEAASELSSTYGQGTVLSGWATQELDRVLRSVGLRYSIQDSVLQILKAGSLLQRTALLLTDESGALAEEPRSASDGLVAAKTLLIPDLYPGRKVVFDTARLKGNFKIDRVKYTGDSFGEAWWARLEMKPL